MEKDLIQSLKKMSDLDFVILSHHIKMAEWVRLLMTKYNVLEMDMADKLGLSTKAQMKTVLNGAYPFDIKFLSRISLVDVELHTQEAKDKLKIKIAK